ncbi:unnamed protein product [Effrenium voratum]|nr:unnamed protein product [Effrenium voratum]
MRADRREPRRAPKAAPRVRSTTSTTSPRTSGPPTFSTVLPRRAEAARGLKLGEAKAKAKKPEVSGPEAGPGQEAGPEQDAGPGKEAGPGPEAGRASVRDRALTLLASSKSEVVKERTEKFIQKHQVVLPSLPAAEAHQGPAQTTTAPSDECAPPGDPGVCSSPGKETQRPTTETSEDAPFGFQQSVSWLVGYLVSCAVLCLRFCLSSLGCMKPLEAPKKRFVEKPPPRAPRFVSRKRGKVGQELLSELEKLELLLDPKELATSCELQDLWKGTDFQELSCFVTPSSRTSSPEIFSCRKMEGGCEVLPRQEEEEAESEKENVEPEIEPVELWNANSEKEQEEVRKAVLLLWLPEEKARCSGGLNPGGQRWRCWLPCQPLRNGDGVLTRSEYLAGQKRRSERVEVTVGGVLNQKLEAFKQYLILSEETGPLPYRVAESFFTALGTLCFVTRVVSPIYAGDLFLQEIEDVVNVSFFVKFLLLFWIRGFNMSWLFSGKGALDLASCLPVLCIPARLIGGPALEQTTDLLQIGRFLRLLRVALPSDSSAGPGGVVIRQVPVTQQIIAVLLSLLGTVVVSATVLYSFENPDTVLAAEERTFEDALIYMVNIFAGRDPPWYPMNPQAKIASVMATTSGIIFIPFLVARSVELFMASDDPDNELAGAFPGVDRRRKLATDQQRGDDGWQLQFGDICA